MHDKYKISEIQEATIVALQKQQSCSFQRDRAIEALHECSRDRLKNCLGDVGERLSRYIDKINIEHPDVNGIATNPQWGEFSKELDYAISLCQTQRDENLGGFASLKQELFSIEDKLETVKTKLGNDYKNVLRQISFVQPRLIKNPQERHLAREVKKSASTQQVSLIKNYASGENYFHDKPDDMRSLVRFVNDETQIHALNEKIKTFSHHKMNEVCRTLEKRINLIKEFNKENYCGFHKIKTSDAAILLAKMHGFRLNDYNQLIVPYRFFDGCYFWANKETDLEEQKKGIILKEKRVLAETTKPVSGFSYQARLYLVSAFDDIPERTRKILGLVECLPDLGNNPAFDYYWVLVPSINVNHPMVKKDNKWKIYVDSEERLFDDEHSVANKLDRMMIEKGIFTPMILGERDGSCYFISMWG
jgi:hypothetical protein